jgi:hypothetical protein
MLGVSVTHVGSASGARRRGGRPLASWRRQRRQEVFARPPRGYPEPMLGYLSPLQFKDQHIRQTIGWTRSGGSNCLVAPYMPLCVDYLFTQSTVRRGAGLCAANWAEAVRGQGLIDDEARPREPGYGCERPPFAFEISRACSADWRRNPAPIHTSLTSKLGESCGLALLTSKAENVSLTAAPSIDGTLIVRRHEAVSPSHMILM